MTIKEVLTNKPLMYHRYVDDTFVTFNSEKECDNFFSFLNSLYPFLRFTLEKEIQSEAKLITSVYKKPTLTGPYSR